MPQHRWCPRIDCPPCTLVGGAGITGVPHPALAVDAEAVRTERGGVFAAGLAKARDNHAVAIAAAVEAVVAAILEVEAGAADGAARHAGIGGLVADEVVTAIVSAAAGVAGGTAILAGGAGAAGDARTAHKAAAVADVGGGVAAGAISPGDHAGGGGAAGGRGVAVSVGLQVAIVAGLAGTAGEASSLAGAEFVRRVCAHRGQSLVAAQFVAAFVWGGAGVADGGGGTRGLFGHAHEVRAHKAGVAAAGRRRDEVGLGKAGVVQGSGRRANEGLGGDVGGLAEELAFAVPALHAGPAGADEGDKEVVAGGGRCGLSLGHEGGAGLDVVDVHGDAAAREGRLKFLHRGIGRVAAAFAESGDVIGGELGSGVRGRTASEAAAAAKKRAQEHALTAAVDGAQLNGVVEEDFPLAFTFGDGLVAAAAGNSESRQERGQKNQRQFREKERASGVWRTTPSEAVEQVPTTHRYTVRWPQGQMTRAR